MVLSFCLQDYSFTFIYLFFFYFIFFYLFVFCWEPIPYKKERNSTLNIL